MASLGGDEFDEKLKSDEVAEIKHAHMSLLAERARVQELEEQVKTLMNQKYTNDSNIIDQLRSSQDALREQLHIVAQSKIDLCESTALEMERLRIIIAELTNHLLQFNGGGSNKIDIDAILSKYNTQIADYKLASSASHLSTSQRITSSNIGRPALGALDQASSDEKLNLDHSNNQQLNEVLITQILDDRPLEQQLNEPQLRDLNLPAHLQPFPHRDNSRIDIRTVTPGDGATYADPFAAVDLKYTGYKYLSEEGTWTKFTSTNISSTVFETRLGNHENIIGLEQAVLTMTKGEVARVWVPARLGYGVHGAEPLIPPNTDLVFELTLVEIRNDQFAALAGVDDDDDEVEMDDDGNAVDIFKRGDNDAVMGGNNPYDANSGLMQNDPFAQIDNSQDNEYTDVPPFQVL
eukprot:CAMPEP_0202688294 /NCGR_PEP_ID=MMETSP1385-20130828/3812_1 /ASSEMBLY_ACC=CAM_ASM_000861 /TAXON_ID=933848 /ORGANISM="Elphidium margaritaceum" /LENGTH=406 /DNA_ID=CAMNT_0049343229 /DNA_START=366 /DNA_END=1586 /DNA_ORIENTATION=+